MILSTVNFFSRLLFDRPCLKAKHRISHPCWPLNRGKNNGRTLIGTAKKWPRPLNRGGCLKGVLFTVLYRQQFWLLAA